MASFTHQYKKIGSIKDPDESETKSDKVKKETSNLKDPLHVWIGMGRDQAQTLKAMIEDTFTPKTGIPVDLELISGMGRLLIPAIVAGTSPDVAIGAAKMRLAFRGALADMTQFPDFNKIKKRFKKSAFVPFTFRDKVWAIPEKQSFAMLFYRKDILDELGLKVPKTWQDVYEILPVLQRHNMNFGLRPNMGSMMMFLYQNEISLFEPDMVETNLDSETSIQLFKQMSNLYTLYNLPIVFNNRNRFRMGEMPLLIGGYNLYNSFQVFAPELRGEWSFTMIPGFRLSDGDVHHTCPVTGTGKTGLKQGARASGKRSNSVTGLAGAATTGTVILKNSTRKQKAWEFVKWWTAADQQARFGRELEAIMGSAARYATANIEALQRLPWDPEMKEELNKQWDWVEGIPPVPGGYYVTRQFNWLYRAVVLNNKPIRESVQDYTRKADKEIARKRSEFGYETNLEDVDEKWLRMYWDNMSQVNKLELDQYKRRH